MIIPQVDTFIAEPNPSSLAPVAPSATQLMDLAYYIRREVFRARGMALGNCVLGGLDVFTPAGSDHIYVNPGVLQVMVPGSAYSTTGASGKIQVPDPSGAATDGAVRLENPNQIPIAISSLPAGESILAVRWKDAADHLDFFTTPCGDPMNVSFPYATAVPLVRIGVYSGLVSYLRDCRPWPYWRPRMSGYNFGFTSGANQLIELGSFVVPPGYGLHLFGSLERLLDQFQTAGHLPILGHWSTGPQPATVGVGYEAQNAPWTRRAGYMEWFYPNQTGSVQVHDINGLLRQRNGMQLMGTNNQDATDHGSLFLRGEVEPFRVSDIDDNQIPIFETKTLPTTP